MAARLIPMKTIGELIEGLKALAGEHPVGHARILQQEQQFLLVEVRGYGISLPTDEADIPKLCIVYEVLGTVQKAVRGVTSLPTTFEIGVHEFRKRYAVRYEDVRTAGYPVG